MCCDGYFKTKVAWMQFIRLISDLTFINHNSSNATWVILAGAIGATFSERLYQDASRINSPAVGVKEV